ncbi:MAG: hypothetical protein R3300_15405 [Candidatus Promineifilaceae bacterium]|nr:hypothetical protein [Candidatus Promineifilaceae bacterium]
MKKDQKQRKVAPGTNRMPEDSAFYEWVVPALLVGLAVLMVVLILIAVAILLGLVQL